MNEIHIKTLKHLFNHWKYLNAEHICEEQEGKEIIDALQAAIEALQKELREDCISFPEGTLKKRGEGYVIYNVEWLKKHWQEELNVMGIECEDCTSKQAVKEQMIKYGFHAPDMTVTEFVEDVLPSVQPERKEIMMKDVKTYCEQRKLVVLTKELFDSMNNTADKMYLYLKDREKKGNV